MNLSVVVPTIRPRSEIEVVRYLDRCEFDDYEVIIREDTPVTKARNEGYRRASGDKILFLDDDSMPRNGYLREASRTLEEHAAVVGRTIHPRDDLFAEDFTAHYDFGDEPRYVDRFWGCNMGLRREALQAAGGWDESMGWGHEEKELAERVLRNYPIYYNPEMVVDHVYAESLVDYWRKRYQLERNAPYYLRKQGASDRQILVDTVDRALSPLSYVGSSVPVMLARSGGIISGTIGRVVGLFENERPC
jgi:GT2 family glycosyltransferase